MSINKLTHLLHLRVFFSFLQIIGVFDYPRNYTSQPTRIIDSLLLVIRLFEKYHFILMFSPNFDRFHLIGIVLMRITCGRSKEAGRRKSRQWYVCVDEKEWEVRRDFFFDFVISPSATFLSNATVAYIGQHVYRYLFLFCPKHHDSNRPVSDRQTDNS
jgi:hypothetical protein